MFRHGVCGDGATQPTGQTCTVANGSGTTGTANVGNVVVTCSELSFSLGGTVSGLNGSGLVLANGSNTLSVPPNATAFTLPAKVANGSSYAVTVQTQPAGLACAVAHGTGTMPASAVTAISVTCTDQPFSLGGSISGYTTAGLVVGERHGHAFGGRRRRHVHAAYARGLQDHLRSHCENPADGTRLHRDQRLRHHAGRGSHHRGRGVRGSNLPREWNHQRLDRERAGTGERQRHARGEFRCRQLHDADAGGLRQCICGGRADAADGLTCSVSSGTGTMSTAAVSVAVTCAANSYTVGGSISGLTTTGLVLANGTDTVSVAANATTFTMPTGVAFGGAYTITVQMQPLGAFCTVGNGSGITGPPTSATSRVTCVNVTYTLGGTVSGLTSTAWRWPTMATHST